MPFHLDFEGCKDSLPLGSLGETSESKSSESSMVALLWRQVDVAKTASELDPDSSAFITAAGGGR